MSIATRILSENAVVPIIWARKPSERTVTLPPSTLPKHLFCNLLFESTRRILVSLGEGPASRTRTFVQVGSQWRILKCFMFEFVGFQENHICLRSIGPHARELNEQVQSVLEILAAQTFDSDGYVC
jgi:hypothetical protein